MKRRYAAYLAGILSALIFANTGDAQVTCDSVFIKEYIAAGNIQPFATKYLTANEILITGRASLSAGGSYELMAVKLHSNGSVAWSILLGGGNNDSLTGIVLLSDNSYLLYGTTTAFGYANGKVLLIHLSNDGNLLWSRQIGDATNSKDRIKDLRQAGDGDLVGTFNINDSSSLSDPVVFKLGLDGTLKWSRRFNNSGDDSFTSIAAADNKIFVSGFFTDIRKRAAVSILNSADGAVISSQKPYYFDTSYDQEIANMEVFNGKISFALWATKQAGNTFLRATLLIQADLAGIKTFETKASIDASPSSVIIKRSHDEGFFLLCNVLSAAPTMIKLSRYNSIEWSSMQSNLPYYFNQQNHGFDITNTNGTISAGYYNNFSTGGINRMVVVKAGETGVSGGCTQRGNTFFTDTVTMRQVQFSWMTVSPDPFGLNQTVLLPQSIFSVNLTNFCDTTYCTDTTALPPPCNKTSLVEYGGAGYTILRDAVTIGDGGKIAVGENNYNGFITRIRNNGDVAWAKKYDEVSHNMIFMRVIKSDTDKVLAFANNYYVIDHYAYQNVKVVKLDVSGTVLFSKEIVRGSAEMADVVATPDGGFIIILNESYGAGYLYSDVIRFDNNLNVIWKKEIKHFTATPIYRSLFCTADAVYIGHDSYDGYNQNKIGIQKLDYTSGNNIWSKGFTIDNNTLRFNKIIVQNDTVYAFIHKLNQIDFSNYDYRIVMLRLNSSGNILNSVTLNCDNMVWPDSYYYIDYSNPTVTFTPENNFVMSNRVKTNGGKALNITRFNTQGTAIWSKNYSQLGAHKVFNIHSQDSGVYVIGTVLSPRTLYPAFKNSFLLKTDNHGEIISTASGVCTAEERPFTSAPVTVNEVDSRIDSVVNLTYFSVNPSNVSVLPVAFDATLFCNQVAYCSSMNLAGSGSSCNLHDTLLYFITNNNCGALARWYYDTTFFSFVSQSGDTLRLLPERSGVSTVTVEIESPCFTINKSLPVSVLLSASQLNIGLDTTICPGTSILLKAGPGYNSYAWNDSSTDSVLLVSSPGTYYVTVTDNCGGSSTDSILVNGINTTFNITGDAEKCNNDTIMLTATAGFNQYQWSPAGSLHSIGNSANVYPLQTTLYYVQAEKFPGCLVKDSFLVTVKTSPLIYLGKDTSICYNKSIHLTAPSGFTSYSWSNGSQSASTNITDQGTYFIEAVYYNGCVSKDTIVIQKYPFINPRLGSDTSICAGSGFRLNPGNYQNYLWNDLSSNSSLAVSASGFYWVDVIDRNGCSASDTINILNIYQQPADFLPDTLSICFGDVLTLRPSEQFSGYSWSNGSSSNMISVKETGSYYLIARNQNGCIGKDTVVVIQKQDCPNTIYFISAFTPNKDGRNDLFKPVITGYCEKYSLTIYNRYGEPVFATKDQSAGWDGVFKGQMQSSDVFVFTCRYKFRGSAEIQKSGTLALIR
jgi:gliding motility-associated-like protein